MNKQIPIQKMRFIKSQRGVTLVELLVSVFVFAIGVLGFSALQTRSLQATYDNGQREDVVAMADSLIGRIRTNNVATSDYVDAINGFGMTCPANPPGTLCAEQQGGGGIALCTEDQVATYDVWDVLCNNVDEATGVISNSGGLGVVSGLDINLNCDDADTTDGDACSDGSDLTLNFTWCAKSIATDANSDDCTQVWSQQSYTLEFRP